MRRLVLPALAALALANGAMAQGRLQTGQSTPPAGEQLAWPSKVDSCAFCHGDKGQSVNPRYPNLAALPAAYIETQLRAFASGARRNPNMGPLAMQLGEPEIADLAAYYARQPARPNPYAPGPKAMLTQGRKLAQAGGCAACHGEAYTGMQAFPRLAGQGADYLARQLDAFAEGTRNEPSGMMKMVASARTPAERRAIAAYLASLDPARR
ncbi:cytochrome c [Novosphingobium sp. AAP93]|uniref:c-type cytochrome n=1 Tax=Novosphingobium sp. AAP93 TaxID=1523427 RepID=UPI0006B89768|nr:c-type cytochrome [Novosphingobium sp. AAP93]